MRTSLIGCILRPWGKFGGDSLTKKLIMWWLCIYQRIGENGLRMAPAIHVILLPGKKMGQSTRC